MFRFASPEYLYLLSIIPALLLFYIFIVKARKRAVKRYGTPELVAVLTPDASPKRMKLKYLLLLTAITVTVFVIAGPQFGSKLETVKRQGIEVMVCLDVSNSMLARDITPNRLEKAKQMLSRLTDDLHNDKMGLIVFAGDAFTQLPITSDHISAKMFLSSINPSMVSTQGTAVASAINLAMRSFTPDEKSSKAIILITDGEDHEGDAIQAATVAVEKGVKVNVVGIGLPQGAPIPMSERNDFMKDNAGNVVITQLNETICKELAQAGNGLYVRADNTNSALTALQTELGKMSKSDVESQTYSEYDEQFPLLAWIVLTLLVIEFLVAERKSRLFRKIKLFSDSSIAEGVRQGNSTLTVVFLILCISSASAQKAERKYMHDGNKQYNQEKYTEAEIDYRKGIEVNPRSVEGTYNLGNALYKQEKYKEAAEQYQLTIGQGERLIKEDPANMQRLAQTFHNMGNISMKSQEYQKSVEAYKQSLRLNPTDEETRYNLALAQKLLQDQQQQQQDQQQDQDKNQDQDKQQQEQNQDQDKQDQQDQKQNQDQQQQQDKEQEQQQTQQQQQQNEQMSRDNAQQMLDAFLQDEKDTQEKVKKVQMQQQQSRKKEKQW